MENKKELHNGRPTIYDFDDSDLNSGDFVFFDTEDNDWLSTEQNVGADNFRDSELYLSLDYIHDETTAQRPLDCSQAPNEPSKKNIPFPYTSFAKEKKVITALEEFGDEEEQWAAYAIYHAIQEAMNLKIEAFNWIFRDEPFPISFEQCCYALYARPDVIRLRLLYELWRIGKGSVGALKGPCVSIPSYVQNWAFNAAQFKGLHALQVIWENPGIHTKDLIKKGISKKTTDTLHAEYIISQTHNGHYYVTGINPIVRQYEKGYFSRSGNRSWSSYFPH